MRKSKTDNEPVKIVPGEGARRPSPVGNKTAVLTLIDTDTGQARSRVVPDVTGASLRKAIADQVLMSRSTLHTDESKSYNLVAGEFAAHESVNHSADEYVRYTPEGIVASNQAENFLLATQAVPGRHASSRVPQAPGPVPGRVRLPVQHPQDLGHRAVPGDDRPVRRHPARLQAARCLTAPSTLHGARQAEPVVLWQ